MNGKEPPKYHGSKQTQGNKKMIQYIEDLERSRQFQRALRRVKKSLKKQDDDKEDRFSKIFNLLIEKYIELNKITKKVIKRTDSGYSRADDTLSELYRLDADLFSAISASYILEGSPAKNFWKEDVDMCSLSDRYDDLTYVGAPELPSFLDRGKLKHAMAYPVSIDIHAFATQRDILDFIEKRWSRIDEMLATYRDDKAIRFRKRKHDREMLDFIWKNRGLSSKIIKKELDKKFPNNKLVYYEITKLINIEKRRRQGRKITEGQ
jgi:hypothetical protein